MHRPLHERLGYSSNDRLLIIHADDIGMCESTISSWRELLDFGLVTSASAMAPCAWFPAAAELAAAVGPRADLGLHLVINCEWSHNYRWSPLTGIVPQDGLVNEDGYFHTLAKYTHTQVKPEAVRRELRAQFERASRLGIDLTHLDSHMFALWHSALMPIYIDLAVEYGIPAYVVRQNAEQVAMACAFSLEEGEKVARQMQEAEAAGRILPIDSWHVFPFGEVLDDEARLQWACERMDEMGPGVHGFNGHPAKDSPELRAIAPDIATRLADHRLFTSREFRDEIASRGFKLIGLRGIKELFQARETASA
jgi:hypothetical protein